MLNVTAKLGGPQQVTGLSSTNLSAAGAINNFFNDPPLPPAFLPLFSLTGADLTNALTLVSGEAATGAQQPAFQLTNQFLNIMLDPFVDGRNNVNGGGAIGFAPEREELPDDVALAYAKILKAPPKPQTFDQPWSVWGAGYGGSNRTTGDAAVDGSHDLSASTAGGAAGLDYRLAPGTVVGFALAGGGTNWSLAQGIGGGKSDAFQAGIYGTARSGPAYLAAALAFTNHWMSTDRLAFASDHLTISPRASTRKAMADGWRAAIALPPTTVVSRPTRRSSPRRSTRRAISRAISPAAVLLSALIHATRPTREASWADASIICYCSIRRPRSPCARVWPGRTTG